MYMECKSEVDSQTRDSLTYRNALHMHISTRLNLLNYARVCNNKLNSMLMGTEGLSDQRMGSGYVPCLLTLWLGPV